MHEQTQPPTTFPIQYPPGHRRPLNAPTSIPWCLVAAHVDQAQRNHFTSLIALAERGGLCPAELVAVLEDRNDRPMDIDAAIRQLTALAIAFRAGQEQARAEADACELEPVL